MTRQLTLVKASGDTATFDLFTVNVWKRELVLTIVADRLPFLPHLTVAVQFVNASAVQTFHWEHLRGCLTENENGIITIVFYTDLIRRGKQCQTMKSR